MFVQLMDLKVGQKLLLKDGTTVAVVDNPGDGIWVETRPLDGAEDGESSLTHCEEIKEALF